MLVDEQEGVLTLKEDVGLKQHADNAVRFAFLLRQSQLLRGGLVAHRRICRRGR